MKIALKSYKPAHQLSEETLAFTASVYIDGKRAGTVSNHGTGGCNEYWFSDRDQEKAFHAFCSSGPEIEATIGSGKGERTFTYKPDADTVIGKLCDAEEIKRELKRWTKTKVVFRTVGMPEGEWLSIAHRGSPEKVREHIQSKYGAELEVMHG